MRKMLFIFFLFILPFYSHAISSSHSHHSIKKILIVVAMEEEATPLIKLLHLNQLPAPDADLPIKAYGGHYNNLDIKLILNGKDPVHHVQNIGTQPAVLSTYLGINKFQPDLIISVGTAGGKATKNVKIGDIYISDKIYFFSRRFHSDDYKRYGIGGYNSMDTSAFTKKLGLKKGTICSSDSFDEDKAEHELFVKLGCEVKEMEAAGISWVSMLKKVPMFALKGITDHIGHISTHDQFEKNSTMVSKKLAIKTRDILDYVSSQSLKQKTHSKN